MKKPLLLISFLATMFATHAQPTNNTVWAAHDENGIFSFYFKFHNDTVSSSMDNIYYTPESYYTYNGTLIKIAEFSGNLCAPTDTGNYMPTTSNDTMIFVYMGDPCFARQMFYIQYYFIRFQGTTAISEKNIEHAYISNPFHETIRIDNVSGDLNFMLYDVNGRMLIEEEIHGNSTWETSPLETGIYFYRLTNGRSQLTGKLLKTEM